MVLKMFQFMSFSLSNVEVTYFLRLDNPYGPNHFFNKKKPQLNGHVARPNWLGAWLEVMN
jgi:hypothetical protein